MDKNNFEEKNPRSPIVWIVAACLLVVLIGVFSSRLIKKNSRATSSNHFGSDNQQRSEPNFSRSQTLSKPVSNHEPGAEETVASLVTQVGRSRREIALAMGRREKALPPPEVTQFFDAIEKGDWNEIERLWKILARKSGQYDGDSKDHDPAINPFWSAILDAYGIAEQAHMWPAQKLLDYGHSIMDALRPGMVYVGGTDPGRWIPELLNEGKGEEQHIIITQNAFADSRYIDYMNELYKGRMETLTQDDSKKIFADYIKDAQKRLEHDQQFPNEPKQIREGENISIVDGKTQASGKTAVMTINEKLFQLLLEKNTNLSFGIEQSFPFKSTYATATPLGPIMEVRVEDPQNSLTPERAAQSVEYWQKTQGQLYGADGKPQLDEKLLLAYGKLATDQAKLLSDRNFTAEAEQAFRIATQISPSSGEALFGYANFLTEQKRAAEAIPTIEKAILANPKNETFRKLLEDIKRQSNH
jgi:tetratricopeptide (TPR) repeat protein